MVRSILGSLILGSSTFSFGADWVWIGSDTQGNTFFVDRDYYSYNKQLKTTDLWYMVTKENNVAKLVDQQASLPKRSDGYVYTSSKELVRYNCAQKRSKKLAGIFYSPSGSVLSTNEVGTNYSTIYPDTVNELFWQIACDTRSKGLDFKYPPSELSGAFTSDTEKNYEKHKALYAFKRESLPKDYVVWYRIEEISGERTKLDVHENIIKPMFEKYRKENLEKVK